jgi:hypothetical protein
MHAHARPRTPVSAGRVMAARRVDPDSDVILEKVHCSHAIKFHSAPDFGGFYSYTIHSGRRFVPKPC